MTLLGLNAVAAIVNELLKLTKNQIIKCSIPKKKFPFKQFRTEFRFTPSNLVISKLAVVLNLHA